MTGPLRRRRYAPRQRELDERRRRAVEPTWRINWTQARADLDESDLRRLGIPETLISNFEFAAAVRRDWATSDTLASAAAYDRRGLLNIIAWLAAEAVEPVS